MAPHSSPLAWKIPWTEEPGRLQSMVSLRVGHNFTFTFHFDALEKKWQPTPMFLPGESQGWGSLVGCCLWGCAESDTTEATQQQQQRIVLPHFVCVTNCWLTFGLSTDLDYVNNAVVNLYVQVFECNYVFFFLSNYLEVERQNCMVYVC